MSETLTIRSPRFRMALSVWAGNSRRLVDVAINQQVRLFLRDVVRITPPSNGSLSKAAGDRRIRRELNGIMRQSRAANAEDPATVHARYRRGRGRVYSNLRTGAVDRRHRVRNLREYIAMIQRKVGLLASGFAPAMRAVGMQVPPWIARHGSGNGSYTNVQGFHGRRIRVVNRIPYAAAVRDLGRRVQSAADNRAVQIEKQSAHYIYQQAATQAGFRVSGGRLAA